MKIKEVLMLALLVISLNALANETSKVILKEGSNLMDINGDGVNDLVIYSRFENNTSHPNNTITIFIIDQQGKYHILPVANDIGFTWSDFILSASTIKIADYSLYKKPDGYFIVSAHKLTGKSHGEDVSDDLPIKFTRYDINSYQDVPGVPTYFWEYRGAYITTDKYHDIDDAFPHFNSEMLK